MLAIRPVDPFAVATLVIAVLGIVLSVASLTWQAAAFVLSGSRVRADLLLHSRECVRPIKRALGRRQQNVAGIHCDIDLVSPGEREIYA